MEGRECFLSLVCCSIKKKKGKCFVIPAKVTETTDKHREKEGWSAWVLWVNESLKAHMLAVGDVSILGMDL